MVTGEYWMVCKGDEPIGSNQYTYYFEAMRALGSARASCGMISICGVMN